MPEIISFSGDSSDVMVSTLAFPHTVNPGLNRVLLVGISHSLGLAGGTLVTGASYGGQPLTELATHGRGTLWMLINPPGGTHDVVIPISQNDIISVNAVTVQDAHQTNPISALAVQEDNTRGIQVSLPSAAGELVIDTLHKRRSPEPVPGPNQTQITPLGATVDTNFDAWAKMSQQAGGPQVTMSWTWADARPCTLIAVSVAPAGSSSGNQAPQVTISGPSTAIAG